MVSGSSVRRQESVDNLALALNGMCVVAGSKCETSNLKTVSAQVLLHLICSVVSQ